MSLLEGWRQWRAARGDCDWILVIAGWDQGGHLERLRRALGGNPQDEGVLFIGPVEGPAKEAALAHATAFILPSHSEGQPMAVLEAWSYGLPVLMTEACNLPEGFATDAAVRIEASGDSIAGALDMLARLRDEDRRAIGRRGRALVAERFAWPGIAAQMIGVYEWLRGRAQRPNCMLDRSVAGMSDLRRRRVD